MIYPVIGFNHIKKNCYKMRRIVHLSPTTLIDNKRLILRAKLKAKKESMTTWEEHINVKMYVNISEINSWHLWTALSIHVYAKTLKIMKSSWKKTAEAATTTTCQWIIANNPIFTDLECFSSLFNKKKKKMRLSTTITRIFLLFFFGCVLVQHTHFILFVHGITW